MTGPRVIQDRDRRVPQPRAGRSVRRGARPPARRAGHASLAAGVTVAVASFVVIGALPVVLDVAAVARGAAGLVGLIVAGCLIGTWVVDRSGQ